MKAMVSDELWKEIEPLLPPHPAHPVGGRPFRSDRAALEGILFVLKSGIPWELLPAVFGLCGMTCWRRLRDWQEADVWARFHQRILERLQGADKLDWSRACVDSTSVRATKGGKQTGPSPTDRGKASTKHHVVVEGHGYPIAECLSAGNVNDCQVLETVVDAVPPVRGKQGHPRKRPKKLHADKAYDHAKCRRALRQRGITPRIARRGIESSERLGRYRWVVERTIAWLKGFRRLRIREERRDDTHLAWLTLACGMICFRHL
jgi:transposase